MMKHKSRPLRSRWGRLPPNPRRAILASLALLGFAGPAVTSGFASGCGAGFAPISQVSGLRVLAVSADKPYARPGDTVTFTMTYADPPGVTETPEIVWFGVCTNPAGGQYYSCYPQLAPLLAALESGNPPPPGLSVGLGATYTVTLPADVVSGAIGGSEGSAFVLFAACVGGQIMPLPGLFDGGGSTSSGGGLAGNFPLGCFDADMQQLPAANFIAGYTEVFAFSDGRTNEPPIVTGLSINQVGTDAGVPDGGHLPAACGVPEAERLGPSGCGKPGPFTQCQNERAEYRITVDLKGPVSEIDPSGKSQSGLPLYEVVWVDYFADQGDLDNPTVLVAAANGDGPGPYLQKTFSTNWIAPPAPADAGTLAANLWAVVHDSRGGESVAHQVVQVP